MDRLLFLRGLRSSPYLNHLGHYSLAIQISLSDDEDLLLMLSLFYCYFQEEEKSPRKNISLSPKKLLMQFDWLLATPTGYVMQSSVIHYKQVQMYTCGNSRILREGATQDWATASASIRTHSGVQTKKM